MNWKNVLFLVSVERKSGRLLRGIKATRYRENSFLSNWPYWVATIIGVLAGLLVGFVFYSLSSRGQITGISIQEVALGLFVSLPTLVLIFNLVFTMLQQIQRSGIKASTQVLYWLPVTWQEHTLASILASLLGFPLAMVLGITSAIIVFSIFNGLILQAILTSLALFAAAFMASATTEILRILQVRFIGAVYKSSGRAAVWVRFIGSMLFFIIFYVLYFYVFSGDFAYIQAITQAQNAVWFIPFVWLGITLFSLVNGLFLQGALFIGLSALFIGGLYYLAVLLNKRFGLYEPPAIKVQKSGIYTPKTGFLGRFGFSTVEAAIIRKDLRAFTRRRELMTIFILPIVFIILPLMQSLGRTSGSVPNQISIFYVVMSFLFPAGLMAMSLGNILIGEEGQAVWRIYASPVSAKNLVKSKYFFVVLFSVITLMVTGLLGVIIYNPSLQVIIVAFLEAIFLILPLGSVSLSIGFRGADFAETPRPRMIRQVSALISLIACFFAGLAVLAPFVPYVISSLLSSFTSSVSFVFFDLVIPVIVSGIISIIITVVFYRINIGSAKELLRKAEI